jgi:hypothetical protein
MVSLEKALTNVTHQRKTKGRPKEDRGMEKAISMLINQECIFSSEEERMFDKLTELYRLWVLLGLLR